jgi:hypothetical protein
VTGLYTCRTRVGARLPVQQHSTVYRDCVSLCTQPQHQQAVGQGRVGLRTESLRHHRSHPVLQISAYVSEGVPGLSSEVRIGHVRARRFIICGRELSSACTWRHEPTQTGQLIAPEGEQLLGQQDDIQLQLGSTRLIIAQRCVGRDWVGPLLIDVPAHTDCVFASRLQTDRCSQGVSLCRPIFRLSGHSQNDASCFGSEWCLFSGGVAHTTATPSHRAPNHSVHGIPAFCSSSQPSVCLSSHHPIHPDTADVCTASDATSIETRTQLVETILPVNGTSDSIIPPLHTDDDSSSRKQIDTS